MDGISAAASILAIATAGVQISIKLINFSNQVGTAPERIRYIGTDVSLTAGVLQQLGDLMKQKPGDNDPFTIFSEGGLVTTRSSATTCESIFKALDDTLKKASKQLRDSQFLPGGHVVLSKGERLKWPFLQPELDTLRAELRDSRQTLMLILQVTTLAYSKKLAELNKPSNLSREDQEELINSILAIQRQQELKSHETSGLPAYGANESIQPDPQSSQTPPLKPPAGNERPFISFQTMTSGSHENGNTISRDGPDSQVSGSKDNPDGQSSTNQPERPIKLPSNPLGRFQIDGNIEPADEEAFFDSRSSDSQDGPQKRPQAKKDLQVWNMIPVVESIFCGYKHTWLMSKMTVPSHMVEKHLSTLKRQDSRSIVHQLDALTWKEREFLDAFVNGNLPDNTLGQDMNFPEDTVINLIAVVVERTEAPHERFSGVESRYIKVFATIQETRTPSNRRENRRESGLFGLGRVSNSEGTAFGFGRFSNNGARLFGAGSRSNSGSGLFGKALPLALPTYLKVHKRHMDTKVLDMHNLPWEWDRDNSQYIIIKQWVHEDEQDVLFKETEELRRDTLFALDTQRPNSSANSVEGNSFGESRRDSKKRSKRSSRLFGFLSSRREKVIGDVKKPEKLQAYASAPSAPEVPISESDEPGLQRLYSKTKPTVKDKADEGQMQILTPEEKERIRRQKLDLEITKLKREAKALQIEHSGYIRSEQRLGRRKGKLRQVQQEASEMRIRRRTRSRRRSRSSFDGALFPRPGREQRIITEQSQEDGSAVRVVELCSNSDDDVALDLATSNDSPDSSASDTDTKLLCSIPIERKTKPSPLKLEIGKRSDEVFGEAQGGSDDGSGRRTPIYGRPYDSEVIMLSEREEEEEKEEEEEPAKPPAQEEDRAKIVDELLAKYTTLYSTPR